jgi:ribonucleotide reductase beta subunit family protein with ferritin-like domain
MYILKNKFMNNNRNDKNFDDPLANMVITSSIQKGAGRNDVNNRRVIIGTGDDAIQLWPLKHTWAWDAYNIGNANHWLPTEISMQLDIEQWKSNTVLTDDERHALKMPALHY